MLPKPVLPPRLFVGARVALVAPSGPLVEPDHVARGEALCRALRLDPVVMPHAGDAHGYFAGTDTNRLADLNAAIRDTSIDGIWCLRGGNGMNRIVDAVDFDAFAAQPKPVVGYSDITLLLLALTMRTGVVTFHGPMARFAMTPFVREHFEFVLMRGTAPARLGHVSVPEGVVVPERGRIVCAVPGTATGRLIGGNLTMLQAMIGTPFMPDLDGAILFLEDVGEDLHRIDRMLGHFRMAGLLERIAGVAIGHFTRMRHATSEGGFGLTEILRHYFAPLGIPVAFGFPIGHVREQWTLPLGVLAELDATAGELVLLEPGVE